MSLVGVEVPCSCPGTPHGTDTVSLAGELDVPMAAAALAAIRAADDSVPDAEANIATVFLHRGIRAWTFTDAAREPLAVTIEHIDERLTWAAGGMEVAEKANELYAGVLFTPLVARMSKASQPGPTADSMSATSEPGAATPPSAPPSLLAVEGGKRSAAKAS